MLVVGALSVGVLAPAALADNDKKGGSKDRFEGQYKDWQKDYWANESLARMMTKGVIQGNGDGTIASNRPVTRLEAAIMVVRLLGLTAPEVPQTPPPAGQNDDKHGNKHDGKHDDKDDDKKFDDDNQIPDWGREAVAIAMQKGFLISDGNKLSPMQPLTRLEAAVMMVKAAGLDADAQVKAGADLNFTDANQIPAKLAGYIAVAVEQGFVTGYEDGSLKGHKTLTRAEWAALLDRLDRQGPDVSKDGRQVKGTITEVNVGSAPSITMTTPVFPGGVTYSVDDTAVFYRGGREITIADIAEQDQVIINLSTDRMILMVTVNNAVKSVSGTVTEFMAPDVNDDGSITLSDKGITTTYVVPVSATVTLGNAAATADDVQEGDQVNVTLEGARVKKIAIKVDSASVQGTLTDVNEGTNSVLPTLTVKGSDNVKTTYSVADYATIKGNGGATLVLTDLMIGDKVVLKTERNLVTSITVNNAVTTVSGTVSKFVEPTTNQDGSMKVTDEGVTTTYLVPVSTTVTLGNAAATLADIQDGDQVTVTLEGARVKKIAIKVAPATVQGTLTDLYEGTNSVLPTITVKGSNNVTTTYSVADYATIKGIRGTAIVLTDLTVGDRVVLKTERNLVTSISVTR